MTRNEFAEATAYLQAGIGREFSDVATLGGVGRGGTYVLWATANGTASGGPTEWSAPAQGQPQPSGPATEVIRPSTGVDVVLPQGTFVTASLDGRCAASSGASGVSIIDMETGTTSPIPGLASSTLEWLE